MLRRMPFLLTLLTVCIIAASDASAAAPHIVVILADDLGYGDVQCLNPGRGRIPTPHLDRLAAQGMTFTDAHSGSSVCTPTRYGLLTGRYAWRTRLQSGVLSNYVTPLIAADRLTLPAMLKSQGYRTACIGKWHLGYTLTDDAAKQKGAKANEKGKGLLIGAPIGAVTKDGPVTRGFDRFIGFHHARMMSSLFEDDRVTRQVEPVEMLSLIAEQSAKYITEQARGDKPFFLYVPLSSPHTPIVPEEAWKGRSRLGDYGDFVMQTDDAVGRILAALDKAGVAEKTLVIFSSDNGCSPAAKVDELEKAGHYASGTRRGYKADIWEGGHRVPFIVRWPGQVKAGSTSDQIACLTDLMATCAEVVEFKLPEDAGEDSVSLLPAFLGKDEKPLREAVVHHSINGRFAIRQGDWKLALCAGSGGWGKPGDAAAKKQGLPDVQLYDLKQDPAESRNLITEQPQVAARLERLLNDYVERGRSTPGAAQKNDVPVKVRGKGDEAASDD